MEKKIKSVKLNKDFSTPSTFVPKGTVAKIGQNVDGKYFVFEDKQGGVSYNEKLIRDTQSDFFEIEYEPITKKFIIELETANRVTFNDLNKMFSDYYGINSITELTNTWQDSDLSEFMVFWYNCPKYHIHNFSVCLEDFKKSKLQ